MASTQRNASVAHGLVNVKSFISTLCLFVSSTVLLALFLKLFLNFNPLLAVFIGYFFGLLVVFIQNYHHIIRKTERYKFKNALKDVASYFIPRLFGLFFSLAATLFLMQYADVGYLLSALAGAILGGIFNLLFAKKLDFISKIDSKYETYLYFIVICYAAISVGSALVGFYNFKEGYDSMIFYNVIHNTAYGNILHSTVKGFNILGDHFEPILLLVAPIYRTFKSIIPLLALQSLATGAAAIIVYKYAKLKELGSKISFLFGVFFLLSANIFYKSAFDEFHPMTIAIPFLLLTVYLLEKNDKWMFIVPFLIAYSCSETLGMVFAPLGLYYFIFKRDNNNKHDRRGLVLLILSVVFTLTYMLVIVPYFRTGGSEYVILFSHLGGSWPEIIKNILLRAALWISHLSLVDFSLLGFYSATYGYLAFRSIKSLVPFPHVLIAVMAGGRYKSLFVASGDYKSSLFNEGASAPSALFTVAAVEGASRLRKKGISKKKIITVLAVLTIISASVLAGGIVFSEYFESEYDQKELKLIDKIDDQGSVSATMRISSVLSARKEIYYFPQKYNQSDWICIDSLDLEKDGSQALHGHPEFTYEYSKKVLQNLIKESKSSNGTYELVGHSGSVWLFRRRNR